MKILIFLVFYTSYSMAREIHPCYGSKRIPYHRLGGRTPYRFVSTGRIQVPTMPNCQLIRIWSFMRHATRYLMNSEIATFQNNRQTQDEIIKNHEEGRGYLCDGLVKNLKTWKPLPNITFVTKDLTTEGYKEAHELGRIYKNAFPSLLVPADEEMNSKNYVFYARSRTHAETSMYAFMEGLFGSKTVVAPAAFENAEFILTPQNKCPMWSYLMATTPNSEANQFINTPEYERMKMNISRKVGFEVSQEQIRYIQDMCRFETAWVRDYLSPWCDIFSDEEWKILEYVGDLGYYYRASSYGIKANDLLSCFALQDMLDKFREIEDGETKERPKAFFYFANSQDILNFISALGIGRDSKVLRADNFGELADRRWRMSYLDPFFGNFVASFYRCNDSSSPNKVMFHLHERLIKFKGCKNGICDWDHIKMVLSKPPGQCIKDCAHKKN